MKKELKDLQEEIRDKVAPLNTHILALAGDGLFYRNGKVVPHYDVLKEIQVMKDLLNDAYTVLVRAED